jgi:hypothetical protein
MTLVRNSLGEIYLSRPTRDGSGNIGGEIFANDSADLDADAGDRSLLDGFPLVFEVGYTGGDREIQFREARCLFEEAATLPVRMAFVRGYDFLVAVSGPAIGMVWLPEKVTPYAVDRPLWQSFCT